MAPAIAQERVNIRFAPDATSTTINGTVRGRDYVDYVLNVRAGPGTGNRIVGGLANGDRVRVLQYLRTGSSTWCQIEMLSDMRERGGVNARYLGR